MLASNLPQSLSMGFNYISKFLNQLQHDFFFFLKYFCINAYVKFQTGQLILNTSSRLYFSLTYFSVYSVYVC